MDAPNRARRARPTATHRTHRANSRTSLHGALRALPAVAALVALGAGCGEADAGGSPGSSGTSAATSDDRPQVLLDQEVGDMVVAFRLPPETASSAVQDDWLRRRRKILLDMKDRSPEFGAAVLAEFHERGDEPAVVRSALLEAAAIANPEAAGPVLVELVTQYGDDLGLRTDACRILGENVPARAHELFPDILLNPQRSSTAPPDEAMLDGWLTACRALELDPGTPLTLLATDMQRDAATRHLAIRALANYPGRISIAALEEVLLESSGNAYMRRLAAQSLIQIGEFETICPILQRVYDREADVNFQLFLHNTIQEHCP